MLDGISGAPFSVLSSENFSSSGSESESESPITTVARSVFGVKKLRPSAKQLQATQPPLKTSNSIIEEKRELTYLKIQFDGFCALLGSGIVPKVYQDCEGNALLFPRNKSDRPLSSIKQESESDSIQAYRNAYHFLEELVLKLKGKITNSDGKFFKRFDAIQGLLLKLKNKEIEPDFGQGAFSLVCKNLWILGKKLNQKDDTENFELKIVKKNPISGRIHERLEKPRKKNDYFKILKSLLKEPCYLKEKNGFGQTALQRALILKSSYWIRILLGLKADLNESDPNGARALEYAISFSPNDVEFLLKLGANPNLRGFEGKTTLQYAIVTENTSLLKLLLDYGADPSLNSQEGCSTFYYALKLGDFFSIEQLLRYGEDLTLIDRSRKIPIQHMLTILDDEKGNQSVDCNLKYLEKKESIIRILKSLSPSLLEEHFFYAIQSGKVAAVEVLIDSGVSINVVDSSGRTALQLAIMNQNKNIINLLLNKDAKPFSPDLKGKTAIWYAIRYGQSHLVEKLLKKGLGITASEEEALDDLFGKNPKVSEIFKKGAFYYPPVELKLTSDWNLAEAIEAMASVTREDLVKPRKKIVLPQKRKDLITHIEEAIDLLKRGFFIALQNDPNDPNKPTVLEGVLDEYNFSPVSLLEYLHALFDRGQKELDFEEFRGMERHRLSVVLMELYSVLDEISAQSQKENTQKNLKQPFCLPAPRLSETIFATPHFKRVGSRALVNAAAQERWEIVRELILRGFDVNQKDKFGRTAIFYAALSGCFRELEWLVAKGADLNIKDKKDQIPLKFFVCNYKNYKRELFFTKENRKKQLITEKQKERIKVLQWLLRHGANPDISDRSGIYLDEILVRREDLDEFVSVVAFSSRASLFDGEENFVSMMLRSVKRIFDNKDTIERFQTCLQNNWNDFRCLVKSLSVPSKENFQEFVNRLKKGSNVGEVFLRNSLHGSVSGVEKLCEYFYDLRNRGIKIITKEAVKEVFDTSSARTYLQEAVPFLSESERVDALCVKLDSFLNGNIENGVEEKESVEILQKLKEMGAHKPVEIVWIGDEMNSRLLPSFLYLICKSRIEEIRKPYQFLNGDYLV